FFQAEDGIRDSSVTGVQTCALPICQREHQDRNSGTCGAFHNGILQRETFPLRRDRERQSSYRRSPDAFRNDDHGRARVMVRCRSRLAPRQPYAGRPRSRRSVSASTSFPSAASDTPATVTLPFSIAPATAARASASATLPSERAFLLPISAISRASVTRRAARRATSTGGCAAPANAASIARLRAGSPF